VRTIAERFPASTDMRGIGEVCSKNGVGGCGGLVQAATSGPCGQTFSASRPLRVAPRSPPRLATLEPVSGWRHRGRTNILILMARPVRTIAAEALELPEEDRLALASELIDSVEGTTDPEWEAAWLRELDAREAQGVERALPWTEVRSRILERLKKS
jgi:hypothetical protein